MRWGIVIVVSCALFVCVTPSQAFRGGGLSTTGEARYLTLGIFTGIVIRPTEDKKTYVSFRLYPQLDLQLNRVQVNLLAGVADLHWRGEDTPLGFASGGGLKFALLPADSQAQIMLFTNAVYNRVRAYDVIEINAGGYLSFKISHAFVFGGVKYSELIIDGNAVTRIPVGITLGLDYFVNPNLFLTAEMHNFDQDALYLGAGYAF